MDPKAFKILQSIQYGQVFKALGELAIHIGTEVKIPKSI
jgi:hypothetical protein